MKKRANGVTHPAYLSNRELTLEEVDLMVRKCNHLHDEEILQTLGRFFGRLSSFFKGEHGGHAAHHSAN